jgi:predicted nuclease of restriction endonuclease-like (RecB) superfamily
MKFDGLISAITDIHRNSAARAAQVVNRTLVVRNWLIGRSIIEFEQDGDDRATYGTRLLPRLSADLKNRGVSGCSRQDLDRYRNFYRLYPQLRTVVVPIDENVDRIRMHPEICATASRKLGRQSVAGSSAEEVLGFSWSHIVEFIKIEDPLQRRFYEIQCLEGAWSVRELQRQIGSLLYERTGLSTDKAGLLAEARKRSTPSTLADLIRDPYVLEFTGLAEKPRYRESDLEQALLDHLQSFLLELGNGFCLEARQKRITVGTEHDWIDLVFYHRILRCHLLIDLKVRPFQHGDVGQMNFYLNWWTENAMGEGDQPPVGLILCTAKDAVKVAYATAGLDQSLFVSRYRVALPSVEELQKLLEADQALLLQSRPLRRRKS